MVLVVRQDLGMGKGKIAAQVGKLQQHQIADLFLKLLIFIPCMQDAEMCMFLYNYHEMLLPSARMISFIFVSVLPCSCWSL